MSVSFGCHCGERKKPIAKRKWRVLARWTRCSAFDGYHVRVSNTSAVMCLACQASGRTKAAYVHVLPDYDPAERLA